MNQHQIKSAVRKLKTSEDFLVLINKLAKNEQGDSFRCFTIQQLNYYSNTSIQLHKRYHKFYIPKKSGDSREILAPAPLLKSILHFVNVILQALYEPTPYAMGFVRGKSIKDNAKVHIGKNYVFNSDLEDFFKSISQYRVYKNLLFEPYRLNSEIAKLVAGLCCVVDAPGKENKGYLPQGSPCSPVITNIVCRKLDYKLYTLAQKYNLSYSRYADDITFSSMHNVYHNDGEFITEFVQIVNGEHFIINNKKTRLQKKGDHQEVTGVIVNKKVNIERKYVRDIRSILYIWKQYGYDIAYSKFLNKYLSSKVYHRTQTPNMCNVIDGKLQYLKMIIGEESNKYKKLRRTFDELRGCNIAKTGTITGYEYVDLGLPSGLKWASCNVGASSIDEYGDYYAFGEIDVKNSYTKYNTKLNIKPASEVFDVAKIKLGGNWRLPTLEEYMELINKCKWAFITQNGKKGYIVYGPNGNSIFLPAAGYRHGSSLYYAGEFGLYWSNTRDESSELCAYALGFDSSSCFVDSNYHYYGLTVRPVSE